jgi:hypothetical protein
MLFKFSIEVTYVCFKDIIISTCNVRIVAWDALVTEAICWNLDIIGIQKLPDFCKHSIPEVLVYPEIC